MEYHHGELINLDCECIYDAADCVTCEEDFCNEPPAWSSSEPFTDEPFTDEPFTDEPFTDEPSTDDSSFGDQIDMLIENFYDCFGKVVDFYHWF